MEEISHMVWWLSCVLLEIAVTSLLGATGMMERVVTILQCQSKKRVVAQTRISL